MMMDSTSNELAKKTIKTTWRNWWIVKHFFSEFPILDGICKCHRKNDIFLHSLRSAIAIIIGTSVMMLDILSMHPSDPLLLRAFKMAIAMGFGMANGAFFYNLILLLKKKDPNST